MAIFGLNKNRFKFDAKNRFNMFGSGSVLSHVLGNTVDPLTADVPARFDRAPYDRMAETQTTMEVGRGAQAARGSQGRLAGMGLNNVPGVAEAIASRDRYATNDRIGAIKARADMAYNQDKQSWDRWRTELLTRLKMYNQQTAIGQADKTAGDFSDIIGTGMTLLFPTMGKK